MLQIEVRRAALVVAVFVSVISQAVSRCPIGSIQGLSPADCYIVQTTPSLWFSAEEDCISKGGHLASVRSGLVNSFVSHIASSPCSSEVWLGGGWNTEISNAWAWTDGTPFAYTNWAPGEPSRPSTPLCLAVRLQNSRWSGQNCYQQKPYICKVPAIYTDDLPGGACMDHNGLSYCANYRFYYNHNDDHDHDHMSGRMDILRGIQETNYTAIRELCLSLSADLPSVHSQAENEWLTEYGFVDNTGYWAYKLGLFRQNAWSPWQWTDGTRVDYTNWVNPSHTDGNDCANHASIGTDGQWYNNKDFCVPYDSAICEKPPQ